MPAEMVKTKTPGVYKRGGRYVVVYRDGTGAQRKESARTYDDARALKSKRDAQVDAGEYHAASREPFRKYAERWVERYQGTGRRGFREGTRDDYRRILGFYAFPYFDEHRGLKLGQITPSHIADYIAWLVDEDVQGRRLSDSTIRNALNPVRACFATAVREGLLRHNPCVGAALPHREQIVDDDDEEVRALSREQLAAFLEVVHPRHRLMFRFLAATGLRVSELIALQWRHLRLDGATPHVRVRRAIVKGRLEPPKSRYGRRDVPLPLVLADELRAWHRETEWPDDEHPVFPSMSGTPLNPENIRHRTLKPAAEEIGAGWLGYHGFRHTCASLLFDRGRNVKQVQRWLGHHSPAFTLNTYVHLLGDERPEPLDLDAELAQGGNRVATSPPFAPAGPEDVIAA